MIGMWRRVDGDMLLGQGLIVSLLAGYVVAIYVAVIAIGALPFGDLRTDFSPPWWLNALALAVIVPTLPPVYRWVRAGVRELVYSSHEDTYPVLAQLGQSLETSPSPQSILPTMAETIAQTLKLPYIAIVPEGGGPGVPPAEFGAPPNGAEVVPIALAYQGQAIGEMRAAARHRDEPLSAADLSVLRDLARQVGIALYAAQLTTELQGAREHLVLAREEERRRIRNDLHDGLAPTLASLQLQLGAARSLIQSDAAQAIAVVDELREDLRHATTEIRALVNDLRPPMLDELGLVGALRSIKLAGSGLDFDVAAPEPMPPLPAAIEVAVYRIASEAIHNVIKHAGATACHAAIECAPGSITLTVSDNGRGLPPGHAAGVGSRSMQERAAELGGTLAVQTREGGGALVTARIPLAQKTEITTRRG